MAVKGPQCLIQCPHLIQCLIQCPHLSMATSRKDQAVGKVCHHARPHAMAVALHQGGGRLAAVGLLTRGALGVSLYMRLVKALFSHDDLVNLVPASDNASRYQDRVLQPMSPAASALLPGKVGSSLSSHSGLQPSRLREGRRRAHRAASPSAGHLSPLSSLQDALPSSMGGRCQKKNPL